MVQSQIHAQFETEVYSSSSQIQCAQTSEGSTEMPAAETESIQSFSKLHLHTTDEAHNNIDIQEFLIHQDSAITTEAGKCDEKNPVQQQEDIYEYEYLCMNNPPT